ncbi:MAG TPA: hypothetical protein VN578_14110 [Candidatus Binatia bacterium]|nr:hypothetical protein [Candidatus Binatia bacterium]
MKSLRAGFALFNIQTGGSLSNCWAEDSAKIPFMQANIDVEAARKSEEADRRRTQSHFGRMLRVLGIVLCLGGVGHSVGVVSFYVRKGIPDVNRVLLDLWIAEAQLLGGALYWQASRAFRAAKPWRAVAAFGALTVISFAAPFIPILVKRAPVIFWIAPGLYLLLSALILARVMKDSPNA